MVICEIVRNQEDILFKPLVLILEICTAKAYLIGVDGAGVRKRHFDSTRTA